MKESLWGYYLVLLGITVSTVMIMVSNMTTTNQQNYYLLKEVTNAAMIDAIDYGYYTEYGEIKINTEKFVENFLRRFSEGISKTNTYKIEFYSIYENPPSVSIKVTSNTGDYNISGNEEKIDVINSIDAIMESNNNIFTSGDYVFYSLPYAICNDDKKAYYEYKGEAVTRVNDNQFRTSNGVIVSSTDSNLIGYCRLTNKALFSLNENSEIVKDIKNKITNQGVLFDMKKLKISDVHYLSLMDNDIDLANRYSALNDVYEISNSIDQVPEEEAKKEYLAKNVKNVKISVVDGEDGKKYLVYGLDFNCDDVSVFYKEGAAYHNSCLIGIKYKIDFYYDF